MSRIVVVVLLLMMSCATVLACRPPDADRNSPRGTDATDSRLPSVVEPENTPSARTSSDGPDDGATGDGPGEASTDGVHHVTLELEPGDPAVEVLVGSNYEISDIVRRRPKRETAAWERLELPRTFELEVPPYNVGNWQECLEIAARCGSAHLLYICIRLGRTPRHHRYRIGGFHTMMLTTAVPPTGRGSGDLRIRSGSEIARDADTWVIDPERTLGGHPLHQNVLAGWARTDQWGTLGPTAMTVIPGMHIAALVWASGRDGPDRDYVYRFTVPARPDYSTPFAAEIAREDWRLMGE